MFALKQPVLIQRSLSRLNGPGRRSIPGFGAVDKPFLRPHASFTLNRAVQFWSSSTRIAPLLPRTFPSSGFESIDPKIKIEEETLSSYDLRMFYPVRMDEVFRERYQVVAKVEWGAYSTIWLCHDLHNNLYRALKMDINTLQYNQAHITYTDIHTGNLLQGVKNEQLFAEIEEDEISGNLTPGRNTSADLFDIYDPEDEFLNNAHHLIVMIALFGSPSREFLDRSQKSLKYWDENGNWRNIEPIPTNRTFESLATKPDDEEEKELFINFISALLWWLQKRDLILFRCSHTCG
ncbi:hypothetical protein LA080_014878 [Diaporthe eres]|nr:hypothetical protein LA080_014878 [Diaporthe eres]